MYQVFSSIAWNSCCCLEVLQAIVEIKAKMTKVESDSLLRKYVVIFLVVSAYWIVSISTVFVNKRLLSQINLDAPMFIAMFQTFTTVLICLLMKSLSEVFPDKINFPQSSPFHRETIKNVLPLSIMFTSMIATNNLCLQYTSVAFYYIGRSLTTIFNVLLTYVLLGESTSKKAVFCCFIIIFGFWLGVDQENIAGTLSISGTIFGIMGSLSLSLYSIYTKKVLPFVKQEIWLLSYYNNIYATILFIPLMVINGELSVIAKYRDLFAFDFWLIMTIGGVFGFGIGFLTSLQIKVTSPLTHNISGTAKACAQTVLASYWFNDIKSFLWWISNFIILFGSAGYARVKQLDMEKVHRTNVDSQKI